ncbi:LCP family protein [Microbacterium murale]|uniref:LCP family protein required for cell wall assembly n=1 Tax=Microbacterium murale TaxID=1081040 RepID=A0ABU0PAY4_9MICO|nr:LCP family protein [Microbacterium murale]MDQ0644488.1 LCP family protein required for cell wall assembly [Microbacterium murale]
MKKLPDALRRSTVARHATLPSPTRTSTGLKLLGAALGAVLVAAIGVGTFVVVDLATRATADSVALEGAPDIAPPALGEYPGAFDVLVLGTDECGPISQQWLGERCEDSDAGILNDANLLVHVSENPRKVTVVSFPRDLMVEVPECTREDGSEASAQGTQSLNSVYAHAGLSCVAQTITELTGVPIGFAAKLSFDGVIQMTDAIGGVEVCIAEPGISDTETGIDWPAGTRNVQGLEALQFLRTRHGVGDGSDLARISNQQQYMSRLAKKILSDEVLSDPSKVLRLANTVADNIVPSDTLSNPLTLGQLALAVKDVPFNDFVFVQYPSYTDPDDPNKVIPNYDSAAALWDALAANQSLELTGGASPNGGVEEIIPPTEPAPEDTAAPEDTPVPEERATLPPELSGTNVGQDTCSAGNLN